MRLHTFAALCAAASVVAIPAFAQTTAPATEPAMQNHAHGAQTGVNPRQQLMHDLQKAGFTNIRIQPEAFVVHATNSQGEPVLMQITPDSVEAVTAIKQGGTNSQAPNMEGKSSSASNGSANAASGTKTE